MKIEPVALFLRDKHGGYTQLGEWDTEIGGMTHISKSEWYADAVPLYTESQLRQLGEACAASCDAIAKGRNSVVGTRCADSVRRLIKEMLP